MRKNNWGFFRRHFVVTTILALSAGLLLAALLSLIPLYYIDPILPQIAAKVLAEVPRESHPVVVETLEKQLSRLIPVEIQILDGEASLRKMMEQRDIVNQQIPQNSDDSIFWEKSGSIFFPRLSVVNRLKFPNDRFLLFDVNRTNPQFADTVFLPIIIVLLTAMLSTAISALLIYRYFARFAQKAGVVIANIKDGDLKSRFNVERMDEIGEAMMKFNEMADEVERNINRLKRTEATRIQVLQDLAHDLRTPIASQKNLLESIRDHEDRMTQDQRQEFLDLSLAEVSYFERLVEDLLFLARMSEPKYEKLEQSVDLSILLEGIVKTWKSRTADIKILREFDSSLQSPVVSGDPILLERLFRNAISNAVSFANSQVIVKVHFEPQRLVISIQDDGKGFSEQEIEEFGKRKPTRTIKGDGVDRVSVGLGAVIMRAVADLHNAELTVENRLESGSVSGAAVHLRIPIT